MDKLTKWEKVFNEKKQRSRGLWKRGRHYYVQCVTLDPQTGIKEQRRHIIPNCITEPQARKEAELLKAKAATGEIYRKSGSPRMDEYIPHYIATCDKSENYKKTTESDLKKWSNWLNNPKLANITTEQILAYRTQLLKEQSKKIGRPVSHRTINLKVGNLKSLLQLAKQENKIQKLPTDGIKQFRHTSKSKRRLEPEEVDKIIKSIQKYCPKSGGQYSDYVKLAAYSGGREQAILNLKWEHIDFKNKLLNFVDKTKYNTPHSVNLNPKLLAHLKKMNSRKSDSPWLFPSPRTESHITSFTTSQKKIEEKLNLDFSDHSFRHYFISMCVMSGIDYMTIADWCGHKDKGIMVAKIYGHLLNSHKINSAKKVKL